MADLAEARRRFADELAERLGLSPQLRDAFAVVERERFLGPPPWKMNHMLGGLRVEETAQPSDLYRDLTVTIDAERTLNNGQPSLHAAVLNTLCFTEREHVVHVGTGTGYYTAVLSELVGAEGRVTAIEIDPELAERTRTHLRDRTNVDVRCGDGSALDPGAADGFYACAGMTHVPPLWLERLRPGGRISIPITTVAPILTAGGYLRVESTATGFGARFVSPVGIYPCVGGRDETLDTAVARAFQEGRWMDVRSLRPDPHDPTPDCFIHAPLSCLSYRDLA